VSRDCLSSELSVSIFLTFTLKGDLKGSISAEHGLGFAKANYIHYSKSEEMIGWMKKVKQLFDPNSILNPYKVLPSH